MDMSKVDNHELQMLAAAPWSERGKAALAELHRRAEAQTPADPNALIQPQESAQAFTRRKLAELHALTAAAPQPPHSNTA